MRFQDIPGQEKLKQALTQAVDQNKMAHAQLFAGQDGGAAFPLALAYSAYILCSNKSNGDACGECSSCSKISKGIHPDVHYFFPKTGSEKDYDKKLPEFLKAFREFIQESPFGLFSDFASKGGFENKSPNISKEDSRRLIKAVSMKSVEGNAKIILVWLPEHFHASAANAILKVLEEPPPNTVYLLVSNAYDGLLATIKSRALLFMVPPFSDVEITEHLVQNGLQQEQAQQVARLAQGSIGEANHLKIGDDSLAYEEFRKWMLDCLGNKFSSLMSRAEVFGKSGKLAQQASIHYALTIIRETMVIGNAELATRSGSEGQFITKFNQFLPSAAKGKMYKELNDALYHLERNANAKMVHFHLSSRFSQLLVK